MSNINIVGKKCTGCTACLCACPKNAIQMVGDREGFLYPSINPISCIDCGICVSVCPAEKEIVPEDLRVGAYYGDANDDSIILRSSSGGAFSVMANYVIRHNGIVFGAVFNSKTKAIEYSDTDITTLDEIRRSKYVASEVSGAFSKVKKELDRGRFVLFCGLPCHVAGLLSYLKKSPENLITVDFICGGTASPAFFRTHLETLEKQYHAEVQSVNFRAKLFGWKEHSIRVDFANGKSYSNYAMCDSFFKGYFEKTYQRDSCYDCKYRLCHEADIIMSDYWGGLMRDIDNNKGLSMIITMSQTADAFFVKVLAEEKHSFSTMPLEYTDYVFKTEKERYSKAFEQKKKFLVMNDRIGFEKTARAFYMKGTQAFRIRRKLGAIRAKLKGTKA